MNYLLAINKVKGAYMPLDLNEVSPDFDYSLFAIDEFTSQFETEDEMLMFLLTKKIIDQDDFFNLKEEERVLIVFLEKERLRRERIVLKNDASYLNPSVIKTFLIKSINNKEKLNYIYTKFVNKTSRYSKKFQLFISNIKNLSYNNIDHIENINSFSYDEYRALGLIIKDCECHMDQTLNNTTAKKFILEEN